MFAMLRSLAAQMRGMLRKTKTQTSSYSGPPIPVVTRRPTVPYSALIESRHYPEWHSKRRKKGQRDRSLRIRSNRRKAQAKARG